jgi:hypothetical protein
MAPINISPRKWHAIGIRLLSLSDVTYFSVRYSIGRVIREIDKLFFFTLLNDI